MKTSHIFWGIFFIALGILVLLNNFSSLYFDWETLVKLWPVLLVLWGLSLFLKDNKVVKGFISGIIAALLALLIFSTFYFFVDVVHDEVNWNGNALVFEDNTDITKYSEPFNSNITESKLYFKSGAGHFEIDGTSEDLFNAVTSGSNNYNLELDTLEGNADIDFSMRDRHFTFGKFKNDVEMKLNAAPIWNMDFEMGAAGINLDLSSYKIQKVKVKMGAAKLRVKFGDKSDNVNFRIEAGVSSIRILVPETSGCEIESETVLSNRHYDGFNKISSGLYRTENFDSAPNKIYLSFNTGISSIKVERYGSSWE